MTILDSATILTEKVNDPLKKLLPISTQAFTGGDETFNLPLAVAVRWNQAGLYACRCDRRKLFGTSTVLTFG